MPSEVSIREILQPKILTCSRDTPIDVAARRMAEARCSSILVLEDDRAVGIWTEHDALALDLGDPGQCHQPISAVMSAPVKTLHIDSSLGEAALRFREAGVRHFLVTDGQGAHQGVISQTDIVLNQGIEYFVSLRELESVFTRQHLTVTGVLPVAAAVAEMRRRRLDAVVVEARDGRVGILTERDVVRVISSGGTGATVEEVASFPLLTVPLSSTLYHARKQFVERRIRHLGVAGADGALVGLLTFSGILANIEHEYVRHLREALRESETSLAASNHRLLSAAKAFESTFEGIFVADAQWVIESVNPAYTRITGYQAEEVVGTQPSFLTGEDHDEGFARAMLESVARTGHWQGELPGRRKDGRRYVEWLNLNTVHDSAGAITSYVGVFSDFTTRKAAEEQLQFLAEHDGLTGLPNRGLLMQRLERAVLHAGRKGTKVAVIFLDLDAFKQVNDVHGHEAGDHLLKVVAQRLTGALRPEDTVARLGGDEFVLVLEALAAVEHLPGVIAKLVAVVSEPIVVGRRELRTSTSVGFSVFPDQAADPHELLRLADAAMYRSKQRGGPEPLRFAVEAEAPPLSPGPAG
jgi:diguanylate cyclase (GGDEF)-like protein/PAS domain S-box-containing protein